MSNYRVPVGIECGAVPQRMKSARFHHDIRKRKMPGSSGLPGKCPSREENLDTKMSRSPSIVRPNPLAVNQ
jgi:hypothetical protein